MKKQNYMMYPRTLTDGEIGAIIPCFVKEVVPNGDYIISPRIRVDFAAFADRFQGNMKASLRFFKVPYSYTWKDWDGYKINGDAKTEPYISVATALAPGGGSVIPYLPWSDKEIADITQTPATLSAHLLRAYRGIVQDFYRFNHGVITAYAKPFNDGEGLDATTPTTLEYALYESDGLTRLMPTQLPVSTPTQQIATAFTAAELATMLKTTQLHSLYQALLNRKPEDFYRLMFGRSKAKAGYPEEIGSYESNITINEIVSTAATDDAPLGAATGLAFASMNGSPFSYQSDDFGLIVGCFCVVPDSNFIYGLHPALQHRSSPDDYLSTNLVNIGNTAAAVRKNIELRCDGNDPTPLGYAPIYNRYRVANHYYAANVVRDRDYQVLHRRVKPANESWAVGELATSYPSEYDYLFSVDEPHYRLSMIVSDSSTIPLPALLPGKISITNDE